MIKMRQLTKISDHMKEPNRNSGAEFLKTSMDRKCNGEYQQESRPRKKKSSRYRLCLVTQSCLTLCDPTARCLRSWGFSRQEHWSGLPFPPPGDLPNPGFKPTPPSLQVNYLPSEPPGKPRYRIGTLEYPMLNRKKLKDEEMLPIGDHQEKNQYHCHSKEKEKGSDSLFEEITEDSPNMERDLGIQVMKVINYSLYQSKTTFSIHIIIKL